MNPNSQHQMWSRWTARVTPATPTTPPYELVRENCARFYRKAFGAASALRIVATETQWQITCRTEGHPAHDPTYVAYLHTNLRRFLLNGFGPQATVKFDVNIEAGDKQDGKPADQAIIGPEPVVLDNRLLRDAPRDQVIGGAHVVLKNKLQEK